MQSSASFASAWSLPLPILLFCAVLGALYFGVPGVRAKGRGASFLTGLFLLLLTYISPFDALARQYLLSADVIERTIAALFVPWLLAAGLGHSPRLRNPGPAKLTPVLAWLAGMGVLAVWYVPSLYNAALSHPVLRDTAILTSVLAGLWFWLPLVGPEGPGKISPVPAGNWYLLAAAVWCSALGLGLAFSRPSQWQLYDNPPDTFGILAEIRGPFRLTRAADQETAGLLFWICSCTVLLCGVMLMFYRWYVGESLKTKLAVHAAIEAKKTEGKPS
jgi:cytochrome c oxidase assembly factor CtaG